MEGYGFENAEKNKYYEHENKEISPFLDHFSFFRQDLFFKFSFVFNRLSNLFRRTQIHIKVTIARLTLLVSPFFTPVIILFTSENSVFQPEVIRIHIKEKCFTSMMQMNKKMKKKQQTCF